MNTLHPTIAAALAPFMPPSLNDDDLYIIDLASRRVVQQIGSASASAAVARQQGLAVRPGQALLRGMQARHLGVLA